MLPEQQQRIMGYFIEEAKDHLNTIEQGLLSLQATIQDADKANEVFRAAHSVKGGAAMLGLESIQTTAHRMEDYFKVLKESPVQVDRTLETMFLRICDGLKDLLEQLEGPFGLTPGKAQEIMADVEPVFGQLEAHLNLLVEKSGGQVKAGAVADKKGAIAEKEGAAAALNASFKRDVASLLRQMLTTFRQPNTADSRQTIRSVCDQLMTIGEQFELSAWCDLVETARLTSANLENDYRTLAPVLIKEIKKAQDLVLAGRSSEIVVCDAMQDLLSEDLLSAEDLMMPSSDELALMDESELVDGLGLDDELAAGTLEINSGIDLEADSAAASEVEIDDFGGLFEQGDDDNFDSSVAASAEAKPSESDELSFDVDFDEVPIELATLNRPINRDIDLNLDLDTDDFSAEMGVSDEAPAAAAASINELFVTDSTPLASEPFELAEGEGFADLLAADALEEMPSELANDDLADDDLADDDLADDDLADDLFGDTFSESAFAVTDNAVDLHHADLTAWEDVSAEGDHTSQSLEAQSLEAQSLEAQSLEAQSLEAQSPEAQSIPLPASQDTDTASLSEDVCGEDIWAEDLWSEGEDDFHGTHPAPAPSPDLFADSELPKLEEIDRSHTEGRLDADETAFEGVLESEGEGEATSENGLEVETKEPVAAATKLRAAKVAARMASRSQIPFTQPRDLDIEFPTLTGAKLQKAEELIDSFFLAPSTDEAEEVAVDEMANTQLDDVPWGELSIEADSPSARDAEPSLLLEEDLDLDQAVVEFDQLLEEGHAGNEAIASETTAAESLSEADLFAAGNSETEGAERLDLEGLNLANDLDLGADLDFKHGVDLANDLDLEADLNWQTDVNHESELDVDIETNGTTDIGDEAADSLSEGAESSAESDDFSEVMITGEEIPDDILAEFQAAFGGSSLERDSVGESTPVEGERAIENTVALESDEDVLDFELLSRIGAEENAVLTGEDGDAGLEPDEPLLSNSGAADDFFELEQGAEVPEAENLAEAFDDDFEALDSLLLKEPNDAVVSEDKLDSTDSIGPNVVEAEATKTRAVETDDTSLAEPADDEDFGDLERLLEGDDASLTTTVFRRPLPQTARRSSARDQNMRVSVKHLDNLSNLVGELVVSRNTLERDQDRLRQFLDNLLLQVQHLNDVGQRMRDLYERSLLESSLMSNRRAHSAMHHQGLSAAPSSSAADPASSRNNSQSNGQHNSQNNAQSNGHHATGETFDALEMDRFTGFHTLSQEMIELIVRVREASSDISYTVESSDQVTRQFRQVTTQLQEGLNTARMVAFSQAADRLPRAVRNISLKCGKEAQLVVEGQDTLIDKMIVENLYDPLTHLVNNAITHGIEMPEVRKAAGKSPEGTITVRAFYQGNQTVIYVSDDGAGINTEFVKRKAIEKKLIGQREAEKLSDIETYDLLFHPGFSTRDQADDLAGRGVGMDVVHTSLAEIRGSITIDSEMGQGTTFTIRLPLTLSISKALSCVSNQARIAFPMDGVEDMLDVPRDRIVKNESGQDCVPWHDTLLAFQPVTDLLKFNRALGRGRVYGGNQDDDMLSIIVLRSTNTFVGVQVDQVIGEQEIVIKQLEGPVPKPLGIAGATVLGDGRVMPIADVLELIDIATGRVRREPASMIWPDTVVEETPMKTEPMVLIVDDSITVRELLSMSFHKVGYRVEQARDGQEAWDKLRSGLPCDLVFCDIEMPKMDGLELLSRMQKDDHLNRIPIAMLTSRGADRHRQMAVDLGASGYFTKPYLEEALLDAAQRMLNGETLEKGRGG